MIVLLFFYTLPEMEYLMNFKKQSLFFALFFICTTLQLNCLNAQSETTSQYATNQNDDTDKQLCAAIDRYHEIESQIENALDEPSSTKNIRQALFQAIEEEDELAVISLLPKSNLFSFLHRNPGPAISLYYIGGQAYKLFNFALGEPIRYNVVEAILYHIRTSFPEGNTNQQNILSLILINGFERADSRLIAMALENGAPIEEAELNYFMLLKSEAAQKFQKQAEYQEIITLFKNYGISQEKMTHCGEWARQEYLRCRRPR